jgi:hypothetical protein
MITDDEQRKYHNFWTYFVHGLFNTGDDDRSLGRSVARFHPSERLGAVAGVQGRWTAHRRPFLSRRGSGEATHSADIDCVARVPSLFELKVGNFYIALEGETNRVQVLKTVRHDMEPYYRVFVGVIAPIDPHVESAEDVRDRVLEAGRYVPLEQLGTTDDCGFAPFADDTSSDTPVAKVGARVARTALVASTLGAPK